MPLVRGFPVIPDLFLRLVERHLACADIAEHLDLDAALTAVVVLGEQLEVIQAAGVPAKGDRDVMIKGPGRFFFVRDSFFAHEPRLDRACVGGGRPNRRAVPLHANRLLNCFLANVRIEGQGGRRARKGHGERDEDKAIDHAQWQ